MTGSLVHASREVLPHRFERARADLDDGTALRLNDMRKFATWHLVTDVREAMPRAGPDALSEACSVAWLRAAFGRRSVAVKAVLLDQQVAAGVGNIYADEACWLARVDPRTPASSLSPRRIRKLHEGLRRTLHDSLLDRGSSFSDYLDGLGAEGLHHTRVHVFRREGQPCERCGHEIVKVRVAGRGTHICTHCQRT
jgi:formamidopyrimidine-DNA glycosylase